MTPAILIVSVLILLIFVDLSNAEPEIYGSDNLRSLLSEQRSSGNKRDRSASTQPKNNPGLRNYGNTCFINSIMHVHNVNVGVDYFFLLL